MNSERALLHPWLENFRENPELELDKLMTGRANLHLFNRADSPEIALALFSKFPKTHDFRKTLDNEIYSWLDHRRLCSREMPTRKLQTYIRQTCEALEIIAQLELPKSIKRLHQNLFVWDEWVSGMTLSSSRDARAEFWRTIALTQSVIIGDTAVGDNRKLQPIWLKICREAGGLFPNYYLQIGLLGLRRLPGQNNGSEIAWLSGLAQWAKQQNPSDKEFKKQWIYLKTLYPRTPARWRVLVDNLLSTAEYRSSDVSAPAWWAVDSDFDAIKNGNFKSKRKLLLPPSREEYEFVLNSTKGRFKTAEPIVDKYIEKYLRYIETIGDNTFLSRSFNAIGRSLIESNSDNLQGRCNKAASICIKGLKWSPNNSFLWDLWVQAIATSGNTEDAELLAWEAVRRMPYDKYLSLSLVKIIQCDPNRANELEELLHAFCNKFPKDEYFAAELLTLTARTPGRDALRLAEKFRQLFQSNLVIASTHAVILSQIEDRKWEALELLQALAREDAEDPYIASFLAKLLVELKPEDNASEAYLVSITNKFWENVKVKEVLRELANLAPNTLEQFKSLISKLDGKSANEEPNRIKLVDESINSPTQTELVTDRTEKIESFESSVKGNIDTTPSSEVIRKSGDTEETISSQRVTANNKALSSELKLTAEVAEYSDGSDFIWKRALRGGAMRRISNRLNSRYDPNCDIAKVELVNILRENPTFAYARLLAKRHQLWEQSNDVLPSFAEALEEALTAEDIEKLRELSKFYPKFSVLALLALATLGDITAAEKVRDWLDENVYKEDSLMMGLHADLNTLFSASEELEFMEGVEKNRTEIITLMYDTNESYMGAEFIAA